MRRAIARGALGLAAVVGVGVSAPSAAAQYAGYAPTQGYPYDPYAQQYGYGQSYNYGQQYAQPYNYAQPYSYTQPYNYTAAYGGYYPGAPNYASGYAAQPYSYAQPYAGTSYAGYPYSATAYGQPYYPPAYNSYAGAPYAGYPVGTPPYGYNGYPPPAALGSLVVPYGSQPYGYPGVGAFQVTAIPTSATTIQLSWTPLPGAISYTVYQGINNQPLTQFTAASVTTTATIPVGVNNTYVFQVAGIGPNGFEIGRSNITPPVVAGTNIGLGGLGASIVNAATSTVIPASSFVPWAAGTQVTVTLRDINRNPVAGRTVIMTALRPGDVATPTFTNPVSDASGNVIFTIRGVGPGPGTFNVSVDGSITLPPLTVTFQ